ncbi:hypothetical protein LCGC14_1968670 [marine sediment metagenome]|uniref:DUF1737 domain-containing protein n=1 Tax=marine sediment metagenome TaxID=412755 RepID=A0A0F9HQV7_9ZZZZ
MKNYQVVRLSGLGDIEDKVNELLLEGWVPTGGIYKEPIGSVYCQAMWRRQSSPIQVTG